MTPNICVLSLADQLTLGSRGSKTPSLFNYTMQENLHQVNHCSEINEKIRVNYSTYAVCKKVQVSNDHEMAQSDRNSHSTNQKVEKN